MTKKKYDIKVLSPWGNYQKIKSLVHTIKGKELPNTLHDSDYIVYANGRSYGDCILNTNTIETEGLNTILSFDTKNGIIQCQSGILFSDILKTIIPNKWFLPVTPGTKYVTIGGVVAADVHGKNHHKDGCFSEFIISLQLLLPDGSIFTCSRTENTELFKATCGGMGLTGIILEVTFQLKPIESVLIEQITIATRSLKDTFDAFEKYSSATYVVAWIDGLSKNIGKGVVLIGEHAKNNQFKLSYSKRITIPKIFPSFILNPLSIKFYNFYYYLKQNKKARNISIDAFFYPLDSIKHWNRLYGKKGFVQYQVVIPKQEGCQGISRLLEEVKKSRHISYLTILKLMRRSNDNYLSFPLEGYTIAMDFKVKKGLWSFLDNLDIIVSEYNGRAYLAKDGRMKKSFFEKGYPKLGAFKAVRKRYNLERVQSLQSKRLDL